MDASTSAAWVGIVITLGVAIVGWSRANSAGRRAARALELAEATEGRANRLEAAQFERGDVRWEIDWNEADRVLTAHSVGLDTAYDVEMVVDPRRDMPGRRQSTTADEVRPTEWISLDLQTALAAATSPAARSRARHEAREINLSVQVQVTWRTHAGSPGTQRWDEVPLLSLWEGHS